MNLPQPKQGQFPNIEILWAGDAETGHLSVSLRVGTLFGVSNEFAHRVAQETIDCEELCVCETHADTSDIMASFHVEQANWEAFAHAIARKVFRRIAAEPEQWDRRNAAVAPIVIDLDGVARKVRQVRMH